MWHKWLGVFVLVFGSPDSVEEIFTRNHSVIIGPYKTLNTGPPTIDYIISTLTGAREINYFSTIIFVHTAPLLNLKSRGALEAPLPEA